LRADVAQMAPLTNKAATAGKPCSPVGASLLAMDVNDNAGCLDDRVAWTSFASKLAPTLAAGDQFTGR
jgi:hypothetical protein